MPMLMIQYHQAAMKRSQIPYGCKVDTEMSFMQHVSA